MATKFSDLQKRYFLEYMFTDKHKRTKSLVLLFLKVKINNYYNCRILWFSFLIVTTCFRRILVATPKRGKAIVFLLGSSQLRQWSTINRMTANVLKGTLHSLMAGLAWWKSKPQNKIFCFLFILYNTKRSAGGLWIRRLCRNDVLEFLKFAIKDAIGNKK
jgi:hypothetical protein